MKNIFIAFFFKKEDANQKNVPNSIVQIIVLFE